MALALTNYIQNAHRLSEYEIDASVTTVYAGQLFQLNAEGRWVYADGTQKAYPTLNDRFQGQGLGLQGERLEGRDNVSRSGKIACLKGNFEIGTDQYDRDATYTPGAPLTASNEAGKEGLITTFDTATDATAGTFPNWALVIGYVTRAPETEDDFLRYEG